METETQQWIKCSDRMPENEKVVEVTYKVPKMDTPNEYWYGVCNAFHEDGGVAAERSQFFTRMAVSLLKEVNFNGIMRCLSSMSSQILGTSPEDGSRMFTQSKSAGRLIMTV